MAASGLVELVADWSGPVTLELGSVVLGWSWTVSLRLISAESHYVEPDRIGPGGREEVIYWS